MRPHRLLLPAALGFLLALSAVTLAPGRTDAASGYAALCAANLRATSSTSGSSVAVIPEGAVISVSAIVSGGAWSANCPGPVSGSTWYMVDAVNGTSVLTLYGALPVYAATGLFATAPTDSVPASPSPTPTPPSPSTYLPGIDVSNHQGTIDWPAVAASGTRFVIMKATEGETYLDPTYAANHAAARAAGLPVTAYHFAQPGLPVQEAVIQADWYVDNADLQPGDMVPALDLEKTGGLSTSQLQAWVGAWLGEVYAKLGVRPMIYTSPNFWKNYMGDTTLFADEGYSVLWVAHWTTSSPTVPAANWGGHGWTFWQYSNCGSVSGITGCVDLDRFNGLDLTPVRFNYTFVPPPLPTTPPNAPPILTAVTPASAPAGGGDLTVTLQGANFTPADSTVRWNGTALQTTYVSPTQVSALVPAALTAAQGQAALQVVNAPPGGGASAPLPFTLTVPAAQLSITPSTSVITWGQKVTLRVGIAQGGANRTLTLQREQANETAWSDIATLTTDAAGTASFDYTPPVNTQFRVVYAGTPDLGPATSAPVRVVVRQIAILRPTSLGKVTRVPAGTKVTFTATVRPIGPALARAKVTFGFWHQVAGHWEFLTKRDVYIDAQGRASWTWTFSPGQWYVRVIADPTVTNANSYWSPLERYSVY